MLLLIADFLQISFSGARIAVAGALASLALGIGISELAFKHGVPLLLHNKCAHAGSCTDTTVCAVGTMCALMPWCMTKLLQKEVCQLHWRSSETSVVIILPPGLRWIARAAGMLSPPAAWPY